jgi:hypothetical protein
MRGLGNFALDSVSKATTTDTEDHEGTAEMEAFVEPVSVARTRGVDVLDSLASQDENLRLFGLEALSARGPRQHTNHTTRAKNE